MHQLVIARFKEDLAWLTQVPADFEIHIFNKGAAVEDPAVLARATSIVQRPNEGRESETYLTYIAGLAQAPESDGFTVFAQGDPFEHSPDFLALLAATADWADIQPLSWRWKTARQIPPPYILERETAAFLHGLRIRPEAFSLQTWTPLGFHDVGTHWLQDTYRTIHGLPDGANIAAHFLAMCGLQELAADADAHLLGRFSYGAVFAARRSRLRALPAEALANLRRASLGHEVYGYVLERLWLHLFGLTFEMPALRAAGSAAPAVGGTVFLPVDTSRRGRSRVRAVLRRFVKLGSR